MASLNKKNGNLRGVKAFVQSNPDGDFDEIPAQGWVIWDNEKYGFNIDLYDGDKLTTLEFTEASLYRILAAISEKAGQKFNETKSKVINNVSCNVAGCNCNPEPMQLEAVPYFNLQR